MLRLAIVSDISTIQAIAVSQKLFNYGQWLYQKMVEHSCIYVFELNNKVVGYIIYFLLGQYNAFCLQIGVSTDYQNYGIGTTLINHLHSILNAQHIERVWAHTLRKKSYNYFRNKLLYSHVINFGPLSIIRKVL